MAAAGGSRANDEVHSTETITLDDTTKTKDDVSDDGGEEDNPSGDSESDTFKDDSDVNDDLKIEDHLVRDETIIGADGSIG